MSLLVCQKESERLQSEIVKAQAALKVLNGHDDPNAEKSVGIQFILT